MLTVADHDLGNADLAGPAERLMQNRVSFFATLLRLKEIWLLEKLLIDLLHVHEVGNIDGMCGLDPHLPEVLVLHHYITAPLVLEAFHAFVGWNFLLVGLRHPFVSDRAKI